MIRLEPPVCSHASLPRLGSYAGVVDRRAARVGFCCAQVWWRAQAAAYIIRPNNYTMAKIRRLRMNPALHNVWQYGRAATHLSVPYPLPPGTISMHVRRAA